MGRNPFNIRTGSHIPVLIKLLQMTAGPVAEFGMGIYSTPLLHYMCSPKRRELYSFDNDGRYIDMFNLAEYADDYHRIIMVDDWDDVKVDKFWSVVFIDHAPAERRKIDAARFAKFASYIVLHDTGWKWEKNYHYKEIYPLFKYRYDYTAVKHYSTILSNFEDLKDFSC
jgi:hypothetical protein